MLHLPSKLRIFSKLTCYDYPRHIFYHKNQQKYHYQKDPYQVFEVGKGVEPWSTSQRDPRKLIDKSIREVAAELALGRFYTRRL